MLISGSIFDMCRIRGDGKKFVSISDLTLSFTSILRGTRAARARGVAVGPSSRRAVELSGRVCSATVCLFVAIRYRRQRQCGRLMRGAERAVC